MAMFISIPDEVTIVNPHTDEETNRKVSFKYFMVESLMADPRWVSAALWVDASHEILEEFRAAQKEKRSYLKLSSDVYNKLKQVTETPQSGYAGFHPSVLPQLRVFIRAILKASDEEPKALRSLPPEPTAS